MAKPKKRKIIKKAVKAMGKKKILKNAKRKNFSVKKIRPKKQKQKIKIKKVRVKKSAKHRKILAKKKNPTSQKLRRVKPRASKKRVEQNHEEFPAEALFKAKIKVIGIGGGGGSIVSEIGKSLEKATFVVADTDVRALSKKKPGIKYLWFGEEFTHGLGTGLNIDLAKKASESAKEKISGIFKDQDIVIFIASLGGGLGSGATKVFADVAKEFGGITLGIFTMPFKFEGPAKYRIAQNALKSLRQSLNVSLVIPNEKIFKVIDANTAITDAFSMVNKSLVESLESLVDLIYSPGIINIDFADLKTILNGLGNIAFLNTIEESGKNRAEKICERIFVNPLLQNSNFEVEKILLNIAGSSSLSMHEVEKISRRVAELSPKAKIIFGISKNLKLNNKIKTTILMTGGGSKTEIPDPKPEIIKETVKVEKVVERKIVQNLVKENKGAKKIKKPRLKKPKNKKPKITKKPKEKIEKKNPEKEPVSFIPIFQASASGLAVVDENKLSIVETQSLSAKTAIRRSGLEIKKAEELEEKKREAQEKEWEIPAFLRKVKYNK